MAALETRLKDYLKKIVNRYYFGHPLFSTIVESLSDAEIELNSNITTAQVIRHPGLQVARIEISPDFCAEYVNSAEDLLFVLAHEALHYVLGHLSPEGRRLAAMYGHEVANIAADIVVNHIIFKFLSAENLQVLEIYREASGCPFVLLQPPSKMKPSFFEREECRRWQQILKSYHDNGNPLDIVFHLTGLAEHISALHRATEWGSFGEVAKTKVEGTRGRTVGRQRFPFRPRGLLRELFEAFGLHEEDTQVSETKKAKIKLREELLSAIKEMAEDEESGIEEISRGGGVLPFYARKDFLFLSTGIPTVLYHANPVPEESRGVRLYVDVSGSVQDDLPHVFYALEAIQEWIVFPIYGFSNEVFPISRKDLLRGKYATTFGTDFDCIARHIMKHRFTNLVLVTDGVAPIERRNAEYLKRHCHILTVLVGSLPLDDTVKEFSHKVIKFELSRVVKYKL
jgi:hypothetical protein